MQPAELVIKKSPFVFLRLVVLILFFFAFLPYTLVTLFGLQDSYEALLLARTVPYALFLTIVNTLLQAMLIGIAFVAWYLPTYRVNRRQIVYQAGGLFEDKVLVDTPDIIRIESQSGPLGSRLSYGTVTIRSGQAASTIQIKDIPNPEVYARQIEQMIDPLLAQSALPASLPATDLLIGGETQHVEFKASLVWDYRQEKVNKNLYEPVMKTITAFLNSAGGTLLIGVNDDGEVLGLAPDYQSLKKQNSDGFENRFNMAFNTMIGVEFRQFVTVSFSEVHGKEFCVVGVQAASQPAYLMYNNAETFYIRAGNASQPLSVSKAARYIQRRFSLET